MKKYALLLLTSMLVLAGCGGNDASSDNAGNANSNNAGAEVSTDANTSTEAATEAVATLSGFVFSHNGVDFTVDMEADAVITALGEPASYYEVPSCAFEGLEKIYDYSSFEITTYEVEDVDYIANIYLKDDLVATPEGISLFMTAEDLINAYGEDYTVAEGQYVFMKDNTKLIVIVTYEGEILSIQYGSTFLD